MDQTLRIGRDWLAIAATAFLTEGLERATPRRTSTLQEV